ncbi:MAG: DUF6799 domain-containing protein [Chryseolinea sp.]
MKIHKMILAMFVSFLLASTLTTSSSYAQAKGDSTALMDYCMMKGGKMMYTKAGKTMPMEKNMTMTNGTTCMVNGKCIMKDGAKLLMKEGECMDMDGNVASSPKELKAKNEMKAMTNYVCPMHPEITSDKPGTCSKCGMALVKKK